MAGLKMSISEIKELMTHLASCNLKKVEVQDIDGFHINIEAQDTTAVQAVVAQSNETQTVVMPIQKQAEKEKHIDGNIVKSPIVGTYYSSPAPDKPAFVTVGSKVKKGDTLFIIESMKLMNEVQSDFDGEVTEMLLSDGTGVEFNQPVMVIK